MLIETERVRVRDFTMEDADALFAILGDAETMANCESAYDFEKTKQFLQHFCIERHGALAAQQKGSGKVIGYILFHEVDGDIYEIGWFFNRSYWRQGYAYESCKALLDYAFREKHAHKVFAETIDPVKSAGLMKKLGMRLEGIQREQAKDASGNWADLFFYGILRAQWYDQQ